MMALDMFEYGWAPDSFQCDFELLAQVPIWLDGCIGIWVIIQMVFYHLVDIALVVGRILVTPPGFTLVILEKMEQESCRR